MRNTVLLDKGWKFILGDATEYACAEFDDSSWGTVSVPHDWAISGPFDSGNDFYSTKIVQNGETSETPHYGRTGGLPHIGVGWYRLELPSDAFVSGGRHYLEFDGVMSHSSVYVNGKEVTGRPFGYSSFCGDITDAVSTDGRNVVAVRVDNPEQSSRWYPGAGIIRDVRLVSKSSRHIGYQGVWLFDTDIDVKRGRATLNVKLNCVNGDGCTVKMTVESPDGSWFRIVTFEELEYHVALENLVFWSPESPALYTVTIELQSDGQVVDSVSLKHGFRLVEFDAERGMSLNGKPYYLKGVCLHHDHGPLGAAFSVAAMRRQLKLLQDMGCNAVRTSHNPPAPQLLDLCDEMGFAVMDEAFDSWELCKCKNDYSQHFKEWHERDLKDFIKRDRNHACVFFWSIGNEINEQSVDDGRRVAVALAKICHKTDPYRLVSAGLDRPDGCIKNDLPTALDLVGWNYKPHRYQELHDKYPTLPQFGSETASTVSSRGCYFFPLTEAQAWKQRDTSVIQCSAFDIEYPPWATTPDKEFLGQDEHPWMFGEFVWTGFDYLGEPTPFDAYWPAHASYFGIYDLVGLPKDRVWLYAARWSDKKILHVLPHWTWPERIGEVTPVVVYTNYDKVELFVNGESAGVRERESSVYRLVWDDVVYAPGKLEAVALDGDGNELAWECVTTAGEAAGLRLTVDRERIASGSKDLAYVTVAVVDGAGVVQPRANVPVTFTVEGAGEFACAGNGDAACTELFQCGTMSTFNGYCVAIVRSGAVAGDVCLKAVAPGLASAEISIVVE